VITPGLSDFDSNRIHRQGANVLLREIDSRARSLEKALGTPPLSLKHLRGRIGAGGSESNPGAGRTGAGANRAGEHGPGLAKTYGERLRGCNVRNMSPEKAEGLSPELQRALDPYLRTLLVHAARHILGPFGVDCDLRRWSLKLAERGGKSGEKRAIIATARKLAVLLHHLWGERRSVRTAAQP
jgi:transposase